MRSPPGGRKSGWGVFRKLDAKIIISPKKGEVRCPVHDRILCKVVPEGIELWCKEKHPVILTWEQIESLRAV